MASGSLNSKFPRKRSRRNNEGYGHYTRSVDKLCTVTETAQLLHISRGNLYRLITEDKLIPIKLGKRTLFSEQELEAFIEGLKRARRPGKRLRA